MSVLLLLLLLLLLVAAAAAAAAATAAAATAAAATAAAATAAAVAAAAAAAAVPCAADAVCELRHGTQQARPSCQQQGPKMVGTSGLQAVQHAQLRHVPAGDCSCWCTAMSEAHH